MTRKYQLTILISSELSSEESFSLHKELTSFIQENQGEIIRSSNPTKRSLGHKIKNKNQAYIADLDFSFNPELINNLIDKIKKEKNIIRHIILIKEPETEKKERKRIPISDPAPRQAAPKKALLGDIDKKIDEILSE